MERTEVSVPDSSLFDHISYETDVDGNGSFIMNEHSEDAERYHGCKILMNRCLAYSKSKDREDLESLEELIQSLESEAEKSQPRLQDEHLEYEKKRDAMMAKYTTAEIARVYLSFMDGNTLPSSKVPQSELDVLIQHFEQLEQQSRKEKGPSLFLDETTKQRLAELTIEFLEGWKLDLDAYRMFYHYTQSGMSLKGVEEGFGQLSILEGDAMEN
jgi:hypothetical protein